MKHLLFVSLLLTLTACGGGSSSSSSAHPISSPTPIANQSAGGLWDGTINTSTGELASVKVLVAEDGRFFSYAVNTSQDCADFSTGKVDVNGDALTGTVQTNVAILSSTTGCQYSDRTTFSTSTIVGSVEQRLQLNVILTTTTSAGHALGSQESLLNYNSLYSKVSDLSKVNANWTTLAGDTLSITADGQLTLQEVDSGCMINGQVSLIDARYNAYAITLTYGSCNTNSAILNNATATGLAYIDDTKSPVVLVFGYNGTTMLASCLEAHVGNCANGTFIIVSSVVKQ